MPGRASAIARADLLDFLRDARIFLAFVFGVSVVGAHFVDTKWPRTFAFVVEESADTTSRAQLFYDIGGGMNETDSAALPILASPAFSTLSFSLPDATVRALRFDPIEGAGTFSIRRARIVDPSGLVLRQFDSNDLIAVNQIATRDDAGAEVRLSTVPNANDPMLVVALRDPIDLSPSTSSRLAHMAVQGLVCLLITAFVAALCFMARSPIASVGRLMSQLSVAVSDPQFLRVDRFAIGCYLGFLTFFVVSVSAGFHGSAISLYSPYMTSGLVQPILGTGKRLRSDEWAFHTPAILHQVYRASPLDAEVSAAGPDYASLLANVPVRHFTTLFRPQFWGFFVLPPAYAFSVYWQFKALLLLTGVFSLLLLLTQSSRIAAFGALWYATSPYMQWTYSWASLLPEMVGLFSIVMCAVFYISVGRRPLLLAAAAVACVAGAVNFAMCAYVPHQIPLVWLGVFLCVWWASVKWTSIFTHHHALARTVAFLGAWIAVAAVMYGFYRDAGPAIRVIANTVYPGHRSSPAGAYPILMLFTHFFSFWEDAQRIPLPQIFNNICECSGFFWLAPVTLFCLRGVSREELYKTRAYWVLAAFAALLFIWLTLPVPQAIVRGLLMDKSAGSRTLHVLGLVNVILVALTLGFVRTRGDVEPAPLRTCILLAAVFASLYPVLQLVNSSTANFFTNGQAAAAAAYATILMVAVVQNRLGILAASVILPQIAVFGLVNPLDRGLKTVESSPMFRFVRSSDELLRHRWIVYSQFVVDPGFFNAVGCDVVTGLKYVPDLKALALFDPAHAFGAVVNQSGFLIAEPESGDGPARFEQLQTGVVRWRVNPLDPALKDIGVRYAAFASKPSIEMAARMKPLITVPVSGFWLYELPDQPR